VSHAFYPLVENDQTDNPADRDSAVTDHHLPTVDENVRFPARIAVYDDVAAAPRVIIIDPCDVRNYLEEITQEVTRLSHEQGGTLPFMVIREVVENLIHAYFIEPTVSILPGGNTIRFSDQGPGIKDKHRALEYGTTSATEEMKRYIRGVGSGLPYVQQYLLDKGGSLLIEDNIERGTIVTISMGTPVRKEDLMEDHVATTSSSQPTTSSLYRPLTRLSSRGHLILTYLDTHEDVGPKELVAAYGLSASTWSRELQALDQAGLTYKQPGGQKRFLTDAARALSS
jgi:hypothetical protein